MTKDGQNNKGVILSEEFLDDFYKHMHMFADSISGYVDEISSVVENIDFEGINKQYSELFDAVDKLVKKYNTNLPEIIKILNTYKWFVPRSIPIPFLFGLVEISKLDNPQERIDNYFFSYFAQNNFKKLKSLVSKWENSGKFKSKRLKIIKDCLNAVINADEGEIPSTLIVPTLIAQIDGIQREYILKETFEMDKSYFKHKEDGTTVGRNEAWEQICNEFEQDEFSSVINDLILDVLFESVYPGESLKAPITFSRHKIMHGEYGYLDYGTVFNTLRTFIIIDFLHDLPL